MNGSCHIAFFGGTFDPIHEGHLDVARKAVDALKLDHVIFIPCRRSPHKSEAPGASDDARLQMLKLATAELPWAMVDDYELRKPPALLHLGNRGPFCERLSRRFQPIPPYWLRSVGIPPSLAEHREAVHGRRIHCRRQRETARTSRELQCPFHRRKPSRFRFKNS